MGALSHTSEFVAADTYNHLHPYYTDDDPDYARRIMAEHSFACLVVEGLDATHLPLLYWPMDWQSPPSLCVIQFVLPAAEHHCPHGQWRRWFDPNRERNFFYSCQKHPKLHFFLQLFNLFFFLLNWQLVWACIWSMKTLLLVLRNDQSINWIYTIYTIVITKTKSINSLLYISVMDKRSPTDKWQMKD